VVAILVRAGVPFGRPVPIDGRTQGRGQVGWSGSQSCMARVVGCGLWVVVVVVIVVSHVLGYFHVQQTYPSSL
jgi:hypothetical protein